MSNKAVFLMFILFSLSSTCKANTPVKKCSGNLPFPLSVKIEDCEVLPCVVKKGTTAKMEVQFVGIKDETYYMEANIRATLLGMTIPYLLPDDIGIVCKNLLYGAYCPLYAGEDVTYRLNFPIDTTVPEVTVKAEVKILDFEKDVLSCYVADLKIKQ